MGDVQACPQPIVFSTQEVPHTQPGRVSTTSALFAAQPSPESKTTVRSKHFGFSRSNRIAPSKSLDMRPCVVGRALRTLRPRMRYQKAACRPTTLCQNTDPTAPSSPSSHVSLAKSCDTERDDLEAGVRGVREAKLLVRSTLQPRERSEQPVHGTSPR